MKFFSPEACNAFQDYDPYRKVYERYERHLEEMRGALPDTVLKLTELPGVDDGLVVRVDHDRRRRRLRITMRCGHLQIGYYDLILTYEDADISPEHDLALAKVARSVKSQTFHGCDLAFHEVDIADGGRIEHRLNFHALEWFFPNVGGYLWFAIRCRALRWRTIPRRSRRIHASEDRYPSGPKT